MKKRTEIGLQIEIIFTAYEGCEATRDHPGDDPKVEIEAVNVLIGDGTWNSKVTKSIPAPEWLVEVVEQDGTIADELYDQACEEWGEEEDRKQEAKYRDD